MQIIGTTYCLGVGCMTKCDTCQHDKNWKALNDMPDAWFRRQRNDMTRINESQCQITSGCHYLAAQQQPEVGK